MVTLFIVITVFQFNAIRKTTAHQLKILRTRYFENSEIQQHYQQYLQETENQAALSD